MTEASIDLLSELSHRFQQRLRDGVYAADVELTPFEARALATIARMPGSNQQVVAARMGCDKAQLTRAIKVLEARLLITREASVENWRALDLKLTAGGAAIFARLQAHRAAVAQDCFANVTAAEREHLSAILTKMIDGLTARPAAASHATAQE